MSKQTLLSIFLIVLIISGGVAWHHAESSEAGAFEAKLASLIKSKEPTFKLAELTNFNWNKVCPVPPYGGLSDIAVQSYTIIGPPPYSNNDGEWYLAFISDASEELHSIAMPIRYTKSPIDCIDKDSAYLSVTRKHLADYGRIISITQTQ